VTNRPIRGYLERESQTALNPSSCNTRHGCRRCIGASLLQVTFSPFRSNNLTHSLGTVVALPHGYLSTWPLGFHGGDGPEYYQARDTAHGSRIGPGRKKPPGFRKIDFSVLALHTQHRFAIDHGRGGIGQPDCSAWAITILAGVPANCCRRYSAAAGSRSTPQ